MRKIFGSVFVVLALGLLFGIPAIAVPNPPTAVDFTVDLPADFAAPGQCTFPFRLSS
jgi:hypothetical protein